jgi:hypothetical protein
MQELEHSPTFAVQDLNGLRWSACKASMPMNGEEYNDLDCGKRKIYG